MATKVFCDTPGCGRKVAPAFYEERGHGVQLFNKINGRDVCKYCAIDAFKTLDDHPRTVEVLAPRVPPRNPTAEMIEEAALTIAPMPCSNVHGMVDIVWRRMYDTWNKSQP